MRPGLILVLALALAACAVPVRFHTSAVGATVKSEAGMFAEYRTDGQRGPVLWPLCATSGQALTRSFPFAEVDGEVRDHPHHESCWFTHGDVNGVDCWAGAGSIVGVGPVRVDAGRSVIAQASEWRDQDGNVIARDQRRWRFYEGPDLRIVDFTIELSGADGDLRLGDTKEGTMALRLRQEFCLEGDGAVGTVRNSEGQTGKAAWGQPARWVAYAAELDGQLHTVAMFDAPGNYGHPTHWHARGYGLFAANPFGLHDFTGAPAGTGDLVVPAGATLRLDYRIWLRVGACDDAAIEAAYREFAAR